MGISTLVTIDSIAVAVVIGLTEISLVDGAITEPRVVILRGFLVGSLALVAVVVSLTVVSLALPVALVVAGVECRLTKFRRASEISVAVPVAAASALAVVAAVRVLIAIVAASITLGI